MSAVEVTYVTYRVVRLRTYICTEYSGLSNGGNEQGLEPQTQPVYCPVRTKYFVVRK